jgi:site-specific DNA recombinase
MRGHSTNPAAIEAEIAHLRSLALDALRRHWRVIFGRTPPADLSKDLLGRMIAYRLQERAFGGLDRESLRFLHGLARHGGSPRRRLKPGTVRGEVHHGEHKPILDSALFEAVGAKLAAQAVERRCRLRGLPAILSGRLFDHRGNRMSPTHANKRGARYRYYVSQAVLQGKPPPPGLVSRVPAAEIEALVVAALRSHLSASSAGGQLPDNDRDLLERHLERVTLTPNHLELRLRELVEPTQAHDPANPSAGRPTASVTTMAVPWTSPVPAAVKSIIHVPAHNTPIKAGRREALLIAIAKARQWIDDLAHGRAANVAVIARREGKAERHIRLLAPLAFVSPRIVSALLDGTAPADLTLTKLARALPYCWAEQERRVQLQRFPCSLD